MIELKDVFDLYNRVAVGGDLFGSTPRFEQEFGCRFRKVGEAVRTSLGVTQDAAFHLSGVTVLPKEAELEFMQLKRWLTHQNGAFVES